MVFLGGTLLVVMIATVESQVHFPTAAPDPNECTASNNQIGTCYEFRSAKFKECTFYPSIDQSDPDVRSHLTANLCRNTGTEVFFCCPFITTVTTDNKVISSSPQPAAIISSPRPDIFPSEDKCGLALRDHVVGGYKTKPGNWPWLAALGEKRDDGGFIPLCGGTLISKQHVISAAHCFDVDFGFKIMVRLGEYDVNVVNEVKTLDFDIVDKRVADWNQNTKENDLILLKLDRPLSNFTDSIRPACLPYHLRNDNLEKYDLIVVGWGVFDNNDRRSSNIPLEGLVPVVPVTECLEKYKEINSKIVIDDRQFCAGRGNTDSCNGDSGGPIHYVDLVRGRFYLAGVVSFGPRKCGDFKLPGVYTRIGHYLDWIEENISQLL